MCVILDFTMLLIAHLHNNCKYTNKNNQGNNLIQHSHQNILKIHENKRNIGNESSLSTVKTLRH